MKAGEQATRDPCALSRKGCVHTVCLPCYTHRPDERKSTFCSSDHVYLASRTHAHHLILESLNAELATWHRLSLTR